MNFIPEPRQSNDIAPFGFETFDGTRMSPFFGKSFHWIVITKEVMCAISNSFLVDFTTKEVMCAFIKPFLVSATRKFTIKEVMCAFIKPFLVSATLNFTTKEVMRAISNLFVDWVVVTKEVMCAFIKPFFVSATRNFTTKEVMRAICHSFRVAFTDFLACFLRIFTTITAIRQIVATGENVYEVV